MKRVYPIAALFLVCIAAAAAYSNTLHYPFVFDDLGYIAGNEEIRSLANFWPPFGTRYLTFLSFALNYHFGGADPFGYRLVNIALHIVNTVLVFSLVTLISSSVRQRAPDPAEKDLGVALAVMVSALFALHPLQTQAVTYTAQRLTSLSALFYLLSLVSYARWRTGGGRLNPVFYALSLLFTFSAQFTKETAFTIPAAIALYELTFYGPDRKRLMLLLPFALAMLIIPLTIFSPLEKAFTYSEANRALQIQDLKTLSPYLYFLTELRVIVTYLRLLVLPVGQNLDYDFRLSGSAFEPGVIFAFFLLAALVVLAVYLLSLSRKPEKAHLSAASFGVMWFFISLSVESSFIPIADVIFEHRVYLPSFGAFLAFSSIVLVFLQKRAAALWPAALLTFIIAAPLGAAAFKRNLVWQSEISLWSDAAQKSPGKFRVHNNLGHALNAAGWHEEAIREFRRALAINPQNHELHYNLGSALFNKGDLDGALEEFEAASRLDSKFALAHSGIGMVYSALGKTDEAIKEFRTALGLDPSLIEARNRLGVAFVEKGLAREAHDAFSTVLVFDRSNVEAYNGLGIALMDLGRTREAQEAFRTALSIMPGFEPARTNLRRAEGAAAD